MDGLSIGGASILTMSSSYRVSTEKTIFSSPETQLGYCNVAGSSFFLPRLKKNVGIYLGLTGDRLMGVDVRKFGLTTHHIEAKNLRDFEETLVNCDTHEEVENVLELFSAKSFDDTKFDENLDTIERCFGGLTVEQIVENLKAEGSEFAQKTLKTLEKASPTSLKVCHRHLNCGRHMSLEDCLRMEWRLCVHFAQRSDLQEGVRATLIDKDMKPKWNPERLEDVTDLQVSRFFQPLPNGDELKFSVKRSTEGRFVELKLTKSSNLHFFLTFLRISKLSLSTFPFSYHSRLS